MKRLLPMAAITIIAAAGCASTGDAELSEKAAERLSAFDRSGDFQTCLPLRSIDRIEALDERHFLVEARNGQFFLNELSGRCNQADGINTRIQYETTQSQLCQNQIIDIVDNSTGFTLGSCSLNGFERLTSIEE